MVFENFETKEELVKVLLLTRYTTGKDIFLAFKKLIEFENIPVKKLVGLDMD